MYKSKSISITVIFTLLFVIFNAPANIITLTADHGLVDNADGVCSISEAIIAANTDSAFNECPTGSGDDTIILSTNITLDSIYNNLTGTPAIDSIITIDGNGFALTRDVNLSCNQDNTNDAGEFRLLYNNLNATLVLQNISLSNGCVIGSGGALYNSGELSIFNSTFTNNFSDSAGAIFNGSAFISTSTIKIIKNSYFSSNIATFGGAIMNRFDDIFFIENTTFVNNNALHGGSIYHNGGTIFEIKNSTFSNNMATFGGAVYNRAFIGRVLNCSFVNNQANDGGTFFESVSDNFIKNSLFKGNSPEDCSTGAGNQITGVNNISDKISSNSGCPGIISTTLTPSTIDILADNGGLTLTHALFMDSEAINLSVNGTTSDQRGLSPSGTRDIGAFEYNGIPLVFKNGFE